MMEIAQQARPSLWLALLWKDFQQVKSTFIAVLAGVFAVQLLLVFSAGFAPNDETRMAFYGGTVTFACIAPILLALGCGGMLIGQERQSATWAWSSSLPASWRLALGSKLVVATVGSLCASVPLAIIPLALWMTRQFPPTAGSLMAIYISSFTVVIFVEVIIFCFLATLLMRETLTALVTAGIGLATVQILLGAWFTDYVTPAIIRWGAPSDQAGLIAIAIFIGCALSIGCVLMVVNFRWRWGIGQQVTFAFWRNSSSVRMPSRVRYPYAAGTAPSEGWMMFRHSCENSLWLRLIVVIGAIVLMTNTTAVAVPDFLPGIALLSMGILGVTAFEADQTLSRFRFLADRGVVPWKLVVSRLSVVAILSLILAIAAFVRLGGRNGGFAFELSLGPIAILMGAFSSMCFRKSVIAITSALVVSLLAISISMAIIQSVQAELGWLGERAVTEFQRIVLYCLPVAIIALAAAIFGLSKRWLVLDDPKLAQHFLWISLTALLSPLFVACTFGFLLLPNAAWQGVAADKLEFKRVSLPRLVSMDLPIFTGALPRLYVLSRSRGRGMEGVAESARDAISVVRSDLEAERNTPAQSLLAVVESMLPQLEDQIRGRRKQVGDTTEFSLQLEYLIARTAALATVALSENDPKVALRLWQLNRELQEIAHQDDPLSTHASRNVAMYFLREVSDHDVEAMGGAGVFRSLIPQVPNERTATLEETREHATASRELVRGNTASLPNPFSGRKSYIFPYYPPLRWLFERQLAADLERDVSRLRLLPENYLTAASRALLVERFPQ